MAASFDFFQTSEEEKRKVALGSRPTPGKIKAGFQVILLGNAQDRMFETWRRCFNLDP